MEENKCPKCGATGLEYKKPYYISAMGQVGFPFKCKECGTTGNEIHRIVFTGYNLDDPDDTKERVAETYYKNHNTKIYATHVLCKHITTINEPSMTRKYHVIVFTQEETGESWTYTTTTSKPSELDVKEGTYYNLIGELTKEDSGQFKALSIYTEVVDVLGVMDDDDIYLRPATATEDEVIPDFLDMLFDKS